MTTAGEELLTVVRAPSAAGGVAVLELHGELDLSTRAALDEAAAACSGSVVLDLRGLTFLDSTGVQILLRLWRRVDGHGGYVRLVYAADQPVARVFWVLGLHELFPPYADVRAATAAPHTR